MKKVITYGTYDRLHYGHIRLLERAKALGDYLIVGVTTDDFDITRGKINVQQSLMERVEAVRNTGLADEIIVEEYEGQKIDDIQKYGIDIFTVGSDWIGKFDYLKEYCQVVYLERTEGVSSSEIRSKDRDLAIGIVGEVSYINKFINECEYVNGAHVAGIYTLNRSILTKSSSEIPVYEQYEDLVKNCDALYVASHPTKHYEQIKLALSLGKHILYEAPCTLSQEQALELFALAQEKNRTLYAGIKTAYTTAYARMILLAKTGKIGDIVSVDAVCTSLRKVDFKNKATLAQTWNSITEWGPTALLPIFQLLGTEYKSKQIYTRIAQGTEKFDEFTKIAFLYPHATASIKVGLGVKSEGELIISGTKGYIYVPAPWWKPDYFEIRYENPMDNKRYFYQLDGEGIRNEIASFVKCIHKDKVAYINQAISLNIVRIMQDFENDTTVYRI